MTESERDAGDRMAELMANEAAQLESVGAPIYMIVAKDFRAAIKAWEDAKEEDK